MAVIKKLKVVATAGNGVPANQIPQELHTYCAQLQSKLPTYGVATGDEDLDRTQLLLALSAKVAQVPAGATLPPNWDAGICFHKVDPNDPSVWDDDVIAVLLVVGSGPGGNPCQAQTGVYDPRVCIIFEA